MSHSYCNLLYHIVFSTKYREPFLIDAIAPRVHRYLGGIIRKREGVPMIINGFADHVHILARLHQDERLCEMVGFIKSVSSHWVSRTFGSCRDFAWQNGFGAFTVSESKVPSVRRYIQKQQEHHARVTFQDEFRSLLDCHGIRYREPEVWD